jgi:hypothetical protein
MSKVFVSVVARHDPQGNTQPLTLKWADGRVFSIDRILDVRQAPSLKCFIDKSLAGTEINILPS